MSARIGALFAGYGGLDMAVSEVYGGELAWYSEIDKGALKILKHRFPEVPNVGDVTTADWSQVEPVDILTGGSPCQDLSHAGRRAGMTEGTRSNLWVAMREAIAQLRPSIVIWENVRGAYSAAADSALEFCSGCMGDPWYRGATLRALGRVLGDLSDLGYDASWHGLRAADVGAPHGRFRVFVAAADASGSRLGKHRRGAPAQEAWPHEGHKFDRDGSLLPTPRATDGTKGGPNQRGSSGDLMLPSAVALLPTPDANADKYRIGGDSQQSRSLAGMARREELLLPTPRVTQAGYADDGRGGKSLDVEARLLPTPSVADTQGGRKGRSGERSDELLLNGIAAAQQWGDYAAAIARWEQTLGRPAPAPTQTSSKGNPQLSPAFVEWMMGLPAGWVTDVPGITRNEALKALGNGVVPQQAADALRLMASWEAVA